MFAVTVWLALMISSIQSSASLIDADRPSTGSPDRRSSISRMLSFAITACKDTQSGVNFKKTNKELLRP